MGSPSKRSLPKQLERIRQSSTGSNNLGIGRAHSRNASLRLVSATSSNLSDLPEDFAIGNDDVVDETENSNNASENFEGIARSKTSILSTQL